jgi:hypothetical protein
MNGIELGATKWLAKVNEKLTFILLSVKEKKEISEADYNLLKMLHRDWWMGEFPIYAHEAMNIKAENVTEQNLFDVTKEQVNTGGTEVESLPEET